YLAFSNDTTGWICGENGVLYYTENGGQDWQIEDIGTSAYLNSIFFINSTHGWIAGSGGIIFRTVDGGQNWIISDNPSFAYLISIHFADTNTGYSCGLDGTILKSTNGGASWVSQESGTENGLIDIHVVSADTVYCVGWYGTILKTTTGGIATPNIVETESKNPSEINLEQNYPNPFNPSTTIAFQVTELISEKAVIKIYSSIGELVQTVTKNINGTGYYSVSWNGESNNGDILPTGNYFYSINYGNTTRNGKMCLIK
ncbi:MAG: YCF48-related protein, partial [Candidatus Zixiibacteriota bacterium]